jgi:penicillin-binding protein 1A
MEKYGYLNKADTTKYSKTINLDLSYVENDSQGDSYIRHAVEKWLDKWCKSKTIMTFMRMA